MIVSASHHLEWNTEEVNFCGLKLRFGWQRAKGMSSSGGSEGARGHFKL